MKTVSKVLTSTAAVSAGVTAVVAAVAGTTLTVIKINGDGPSDLGPIKDMLKEASVIGKDVAILGTGAIVSAALLSQTKSRGKEAMDSIRIIKSLAKDAILK